MAAFMEGALFAAGHTNADGVVVIQQNFNSCMDGQGVTTSFYSPVVTALLEGARKMKPDDIL